MRRFRENQPCRFYLREMNIRIGDPTVRVVGAINYQKKNLLQRPAFTATVSGDATRSGIISC